MRPTIFLWVVLHVGFTTWSQTPAVPVITVQVQEDIRITIDQPSGQLHKKRIIVFYALPNGNTTEQTRGKKMAPGDDWHYDIQHIAAQTGFLRSLLRRESLIVIYLENDLKSWPAWKQKHPDFRSRIPNLVDSLAKANGGTNYKIYLNGHSGGGSLIFGYFAGVDPIPSRIQRISFIDSDYGYDSSYYPKLKNWLSRVKGATLSVFAYNDSVALYNGKPVVSATGGTWYRSRLMLAHFRKDYSFRHAADDSIFSEISENNRIHFYFKPNLDHGIYHTQQVEYNGFIHSLLCGTKYESRLYRYYGPRAYAPWIQ